MGTQFGMFMESRLAVRTLFGGRGEGVKYAVDAQKKG